jgi:hypothetical protein
MTPAHPNRPCTEQDPRWQQVLQRSPAADGRFVYAVRTTGIYTSHCEFQWTLICMPDIVFTLSTRTVGGEVTSKNTFH